MASAPALLQVASFSFSRKGAYTHEGSRSGSTATLSWNDTELSLKSGKTASELVPVATLKWEQVSAVWAFVKSHHGRGFQLEITLESSRGAAPLEFLTLKAAMDSAAGAFLDFLQESLPGRVKDGRAPTFATSRWAMPVYQQGLSMRTLRLLLSRTEMCFDLLFAICFFAHIEKVFWSREAKFMDAVSDLVDDIRKVYQEVLEGFVAEVNAMDVVTILQTGLVALPLPLIKVSYKLARHTSHWVMLPLLLQHFMAVLVTLRSLMSTVKALMGSAKTVHTVAAKAHAQVTKAQPSKRAQQGAAEGVAESKLLETEATENKTDTGGGDDGLRQRKIAQ